VHCHAYCAACAPRQGLEYLKGTLRNLGSLSSLVHHHLPISSLLHEFWELVMLCMLFSKVDGLGFESSEVLKLLHIIVAGPKS
jgi:hypothetical protein